MPTAKQSQQPPHPLAECVTWELAAYRERLEAALALPTLPPGWPSREVVQIRLDAVVAEEAERAAIRRGKLWPANA